MTEISCVWTGGLNVIKLQILPKLISRSWRISKNSSTPFVDRGKLKCVESKGPGRQKIILRKSKTKLTLHGQPFLWALLPPALVLWPEHSGCVPLTPWAQRPPTDCELIQMVRIQGCPNSHLLSLLISLQLQTKPGTELVLNNGLKNE